MDQCIFCKIINKEIPAHIVFENDDVIAFLDRQQTTVGHTLVVPKTHYDNLLTTPIDVLHAVILVTQKIAQAQIKSLHATGINILNNNYSSAGQTVMHVHMHVIPRYNDKDLFKLSMLTNDNLPTLNLPAIASTLKTHLKSR